MLCPLCHKHKLLRAEEKWFCPHCYNVYHHLPLYGLSSRIKHSLHGKRYSMILNHPNLNAPNYRSL
jgi:ribosomal protein L37AE/L43A